MSGTFTELQMKAAKALANMYETGHPIGKYETLVILGDGAGITFGKTQTTENGGGLWKLIFEEYAKLDGDFVEDFAPYKSILYNKDGGGSKDALTNNEDFKSLLIQAAKEDVKMRKAQDMHFHRNYFRPALQFAENYKITQPLILATIYDIFIHSGPKGGGRFIDNFDEKWEYPSDLGFDPEGETTDEQEIELERRWGLGLIKTRDHWLRTFTSKSASHTEVVRKSVYRTESLLELAENGHWMLKPPFPAGVKRYRYTITEEILSHVF